MTSGGDVLRGLRTVTWLVALLLATTACAGGGGVTLAASDLPRALPSAAEADVAEAARGESQFGADLYPLLAAGDENLVFSPASVFLALAMAYAGAAGVTAEEMAAVLRLTVPADDLHPTLNALETSLTSRPVDLDERGDVSLTLVNSLWGQQGFVFLDEFLDTLAVNYGAGMRLVDFVDRRDEAAEAINDWVGDATNDRITDLIDPAILTELTRLVLVNALHLAATWRSPFDPELTAEGSFRRQDGSTVAVPMMRRTAAFRYGAGAGWLAVELPYVGGELSMLLLIPDVDRFAEVEAGLGEGLLVQAEQVLEPTEVSLTMPKFEFSTTAELVDPLRRLGMEAAFDPLGADFSGMTGAPDLFISHVAHQAFIAVDEEGTEAAAATAVVMELTAAPEPPVELTIDRPFIFALRDGPTGTVLFLGRVMDPGG